MNITEALNVALPDIPARTIAQRYPRIAPDIVSKEHVEDGKPVIRIYVPSAEVMYKFPPQYWALAQLFDGKRSYEEIAQIFSRQSGSDYSAEEIREFAADLEAEDFWYKTPQEKNILLMQKGSEARRKKWKAKNQYADPSLILFPAFNPDKFLTWFYSYTAFVYTPWFTLLTLLAFGITAGITITHWSEIGHDTLEFYTFTDKHWGDVLQFYLTAVVVLGFHEFGHAHACKHYGGRVPAMGFALIYLTPAFYTDTTEGDVKGTRGQRRIIALAGVWAELMICAIATPIWWGTPPDTPVHNAAYIVLLISGISSAFLNWNPLMKLDGYHMLCEILGIVDLKEASTAYVSAWVKRHIWRLPVEVPYVPKRRRFGFAMYALLSGAYSYTVLYIVARFAGNIVRNFSPEWGFIPELAVAGLIFRSRIRLLVNFMKFVYLDKKDRVRAWFTLGRSLGIGAAVTGLLFIPLRHDSVAGRFILEPSARAVVRAVVPGIVTKAYTDEGKWVAVGAPLLRLRNLPLQSTLAHSEADYTIASGRATSAALHYGNFGPAVKERERLAQQTLELSSEAANLELKSPISGVILTPRVSDIVGAYVTEGTELAEVADLSLMRARIYIAEHDVYKFQIGSRARLNVDGFLKKWEAEAVSIAPTSSAIDPGLADHNLYKGLLTPNFYLVDLFVSNRDGALKPGMKGLARLYGRRSSIAGLAWQQVGNFFSRKVW